MVGMIERSLYFQNLFTYPPKLDMQSINHVMKGILGSFFLNCCQISNQGFYTDHLVYIKPNNLLVSIELHHALHYSITLYFCEILYFYDSLFLTEAFYINFSLKTGGDSLSQSFFFFFSPLHFPVFHNINRVEITVMCYQESNLCLAKI